jgi:Asp-tRNA(Asn)/Glu-tRNA(Gln) amidotransferase A subunit family amidase
LHLIGSPFKEKKLLKIASLIENKIWQYMMFYLF